MRGRTQLTDLLTVEEVAKYLRLETVTVYRYVKAGRLPVVRPLDPKLKWMRVRPSDLEAFTGRPLERAK